jgi:hypothetical protein
VKQTLIISGVVGLVVLIAWVLIDSGIILGFSGKIPTKPTDTTYVQNYEPPVVRDVTPPQTVIVYQERDTSLRKALEKGNIISGMEIRNGILEIHHVTPDAQVYEQHYDISNIRSFTMDSSMQVEVKPKRRIGKWLKKTAIIAGIAVAAIATIIIAK